MMKKVTIITQYFRPEMGAPQNRLFELAKGMQEEGFNVSIITGMPNYPTGHIFPNYRKKLFCKEFIDELVILRYWLYAIFFINSIVCIILFNKKKERYNNCGEFSFDFRNFGLDVSSIKWK